MILLGSLVLPLMHQGTAVAVGADNEEGFVVFSDPGEVVVGEVEALVAM